LFEAYGTLTEVAVLRDRTSSAHKGCAFVSFSTPESANKAVAALDGKVTLGQRPLIVRVANERDANKGLCRLLFPPSQLAELVSVFVLIFFFFFLL
jgi:RNA recognition motif-containing protein